MEAVALTILVQTPMLEVVLVIPTVLMMLDPPESICGTMVSGTSYHVILILG